SPPDCRRTRRRRTDAEHGGGCSTMTGAGGAAVPAAVSSRRHDPARWPASPARPETVRGCRSHEPLPTVDLLAGVVAPRVSTDRVGTLDRLGVHQPSTRIRIP